MYIHNLILVTWFKDNTSSRKVINYCKDRKEINDILKGYLKSPDYLTHTIYINENCL